MFVSYLDASLLHFACFFLRTVEVIGESSLREDSQSLSLAVGRIIRHGVLSLYLSFMATVACWICYRVVPGSNPVADT